MITLALDASTYNGSVCVSRGRELVAARDVAMRDAHGDHFMPAVEATLGDAGCAVGQIARFVCGGGPGSFTSLRIAGAIAKGLAMATGRPLYAVSSLALLVGAIEPPPPAGEYVAVLDALRGEYYMAACRVDESGNVVDVGDAALVGRDDLEAFARAGRRVVGNPDDGLVAPHARGVLKVEALLERDGPVDLALWEPAYGRVAEAQRRWEAAHGRALPRA